MYLVRFRKDGKKAKVKDQSYELQEQAIARLDAAEKGWVQTLLSTDEVAQLNSNDPAYIPFNRAVSLHRALWHLAILTDLGEWLEWTIQETE